MKRLLLSLLALALVTGMNSSIAAPKAKSGAKCSKAGQVQTVGAKKFTCIKSGSKLVWNKGVAVKPATKASPTATPSPVETTQSPEPSPTPSSTLVKFKNCTEVKAAGVAPITKKTSPELYNLNAGLDRDKDGIACDI